MDILAETGTLEIADEGAIVVGKDGKRRLLEADTVVLAVGAKSNRNLFEALKDSELEVYAIGDCVELRKVVNAIWEGDSARRGWFRAGFSI